MKAQQPQRRRYDTTELVGQIQRERRNGIILALSGALIMAILLSLYICGIGGSKVPEVPEGTTDVAPPPPLATSPKVRKSAPNNAPRPKPKKNAAAQMTPPASQTPKKDVPAKTTKKRSVAPAQIRMTATKATVLLVNGQRVAKGKRKTFSLAPGDHVVEARVSRQAFSRKLRLEAGHTYIMRVDASKKKIFLRKAN